MIPTTGEETVARHLRLHIRRWELDRLGPDARGFIRELNPDMDTMTPPRSKSVLFFRALRRRCPRCGGGPIFSRWIQMAVQCPGCGLALSRGENGYGLGALWFNLLAAEAFSTTVFLSVVVATWPDPPWGYLQYAGPTEALIMPVIFYPFSKALFLAFDHWLRPSEPGDTVIVSPALSPPEPASTPATRLHVSP